MASPDGVSVTSEAKSFDQQSVAGAAAATVNSQTSKASRRPSGSTPSALPQPEDVANKRQKRQLSKKELRDLERKEMEEKAPAAPSCPLCKSGNISFFAFEERRYWYSCSLCHMVFSHPDSRPGPDLEKARYDMHKNTPDDEGYRQFLCKAIDPLLDLLLKQQHQQSSAAADAASDAKSLSRALKGLDYGCGPSPTLSMIVKEKSGLEMKNFDPYYSNDQSLLAPPNAPYDFITCTETAEHFYNPPQEFDKLDQVLGPSGLLVIMTQFVLRDKFRGWWYVRDPTHVCLYSPPTMRWLAARYGWRIVHSDDWSVVAFQKQPFTLDAKPSGSDASDPSVPAS